MILDMAQSMSLLIISLLAIALLLKILVIVHGQTRHVKNLEHRLNAMESLNENLNIVSEDSTIERKEV
ncbi:hypothetical protein H7142_03635 [Candidatus Saccharibacteria bacterium]|nr:hypothetical protein [Candidatus Saccharibacteria bacterium]